MSARINVSKLMGQTFHYLTIVEDLGGIKGKTYVKCKCKCGNEKEYVLNRVRSGHTRSCGCILKEDNVNFLNRKYGKLTVIEDLGRINNARRIKAICECGSIKEINLRSLKNGATQSCGCYLKEQSGKRSTKHGLSKHPLMKIWYAMKARCNNPNDTSYENYGGRGVKVSMRWENDFEAFYTWCINNGWQQGMDVDKDIKSSTGRGILYCPELCCIVSRKDNLRTKSNNRYLELNGEKRCIAEWSELLGIKRRTIEDRLSKGWAIEQVLTPYKNN